MSTPIIALGQQPNGFFPKRYFYAKITAARKLREQVGGKIILFYHDSDADYRETITIMRDIKTHDEVRLNFTQENKIQKNFSPLYLKRIPENWKADVLKQLPRFVSKEMIELFAAVNETNAADFCLEMYKKLGLLEGIEVVRSSDKGFREAALTSLSSRASQNFPLHENFDESRDPLDFVIQSNNEQWYADVPYENEIVRAKILPLPATHYPLPTTHYSAQLHHGGGKTTEFEVADVLQKNQITPGRDDRFKWMNSVIKATHYITGNAEYDYLKREQFPEVKFIKRDQIENQDFAWLPQ